MDRRRRLLIALTALLAVAADPPGARLLPIAPDLPSIPRHGENAGLDDWLQAQASAAAPAAAPTGRTERALVRA